MAEITNTERGFPGTDGPSKPSPKNQRAAARSARGDGGERKDPMPNALLPIREEPGYHLYRVIGFGVGSATLAPHVAIDLGRKLQELNLLDETLQITIVGTASDSRMQTLDPHALGLLRADVIRQLLVKMGLDRASIHAVSDGIRGAKGPEADLNTKGQERGAYIHIRTGARKPLSLAEIFPGAVEDPSLQDAFKRAGKKAIDSTVEGLSRGKAPSSPTKLLEKISIDVLADYSNLVNAAKFGERCQMAFAESWAATLATLIHDPKKQNRQALQRFLMGRRKPDIHQLEAERAQLPRDGLYGELQLGQFQLAGAFAAYEVATRLGNFDQFSAEVRQPTVEGTKAFLKSTLMNTLKSRPASAPGPAPKR